ncbi:MAG: LamG-like jellyroll fold domain-containing protein [Chloroflexota bacterium]
MTIQPNFHWQFNEREGSGTTDSISGVKGGFASVSFQLHGRIGPAIRFHSKSSRVQFVSDEVGQFGTSDFTIAFGMLIISTHRQDGLDIIGNRSSSGHGNWVSLRLVDRTGLQFEVDEDRNATHYIKVRANKILKAKRWFHVAIVREGRTLKIYVDGVLQAEATSDTGIANIDNGVALRLGHYREETPTARYEDLRIYHTALNAVQVQNLIPPPNRLLRPGQVELTGMTDAMIILSQSETDLFQYTGDFQKLRLGPNTGATLYRGADFTGTFQKLYADVPEIRFTKLGTFPRSVHIWSSVGEPFTGNWIIKAPNGQNLSRSQHTLTTSSNHAQDELFSFHYQPNFDLPLLIPSNAEEITLLSVGDESAVLVVDDSEVDEDAFSITHPEREEWLTLRSDNSFSWTQQQSDRAIFHRVAKLADNEGQVGELKTGEVALYQHNAYKGNTWVLSDNQHNLAGKFGTLREFTGLDNQISSIRLGPNTGITIFANENLTTREENRETEIEDITNNVPDLKETQVGDNTISSLKIFRTVAPETIFTSVTSKLSQDYRMVDDVLEEFSAYRTILHLASQVTEIEVSATDLTTIEVAGNVHEIDELRSVTLSSNLLQQIMITSEADGLSTPGLKFRTSNMVENQFVVIFPHRDAHEQIAALEDDALWNATDAQGNLIIDQTKHSRAEIASVQNTIKRTMATVVTTDDEADPNANVKAVSGLNPVISKKQIISGDMIENPWTLNFQPPPTATISDGSAGLVQELPNIWEEPLEQDNFEQLLAQAEITSAGDIGKIDSTVALRAGGFFGSIGDALKNAASVTLGVFNGALNAIIKVGERIIRFVLDTAKKVADFVTAVVEQVVEAIQQFIEFLQFIFDWDDILETQQYIENTIFLALDSAIGMANTAKDAVSDFIDTLQETIEDGINSIIRELGFEPSQVRSGPEFEIPEGVHWFLNKLLEAFQFTPFSLLLDLITGAGSESDDNEDEPLEQAFQHLLAALEDLVGVATRVSEGLFETVETLLTDPQRPELALVEILETFRDAGIQALDFGENIAFAILDAFIAAIDLIRDILSGEMRIPFISDLLDLIGAGPFKPIKMITMIVALPLTAASKLTTGEAPFKNLALPEFPDQVDTSVQTRIVSLADEPEPDKEHTIRKMKGFGEAAIWADTINGIITFFLDAVPEDVDDEGVTTLPFEIASIGLNWVSWLSSFPGSPVEPGGYPYNFFKDKHQIPKDLSNNENRQMFLEWMIWGYRTTTLTYETVLLIVSTIKGDTSILPKQLSRRANVVTTSISTFIALGDLALSGYYFSLIPKDDDTRGVQIASEVIGLAPAIFSGLRHVPSSTPAGIGAIVTLGTINIIAGTLPLTTGRTLLDADIDEFRAGG